MLAAQKLAKKISIMKYMALFMLLSICYISSAQNVGIGTTSPVARLHVSDSAVLFSGPLTVPAITNFDPPASGIGVRMMWYPQKAAFRAGFSGGANWDKDNIGGYSFAIGSNTTALGSASVSMGIASRSDGVGATSIGGGTIALGDYSLSTGNGSHSNGMASFTTGFNTIASGMGSASLGNETIAFGNYSVSMGNTTTARGLAATAMGFTTAAASDYSLVVGLYNDSTSINSLFEVGNGTANNARSNAFTVLKSGKIGIGTTTPSNLLTFAPSLGKKISLFPGGLGDAGFGVFGNELRMYADNPNADVTIGNDSYVDGFSEKMRIKANGNVGIGITNPTNLLTFAPIGGKKISLFPGSTGDAGMGIYPNEFRQYSDNSNADITFGYDNYGAGFSEKVRFKASGMVGIGTATPALSTGLSGMVVQNSSYIQLRVQSSASAAGMEFKPSTGNQYEIQADNSNNWFVYNRNVNAYRLFINGSGFVGIGTNNPTQALQVVGNILASGTITPSDIRYKKNIQPIQSPIEKLAQLNGVTYKYRKEEFPQMGFTDKEQIGLIAQEVEKVFPQLVVTDDKGFKAVDYVKLVPVLIETAKAQQVQIDKQQHQHEEDLKRLERLEAQIKLLIEKK